MMRLESNKRDSIAQGVIVHSYIEIGDELFADCDFHSARDEIIRSLKGREVPIELGVLLHNYVQYPSKITAIPLIKYDVRFAAYFSSNGRCESSKVQCAV